MFYTAPCRGRDRQPGIGDASHQPGLKLRKFAEGSGQSAGEFFTPTEVGFLMAHIMRPKPGEHCHDYTERQPARRREQAVSRRARSASIGR